MTSMTLSRKRTASRTVFLSLSQSTSAVSATMLRQVDGAEVAGLVRQQRLLAAGVGALDLADWGVGLSRVDAVEEDDPRLAVLPGLLDDLLEDLAGVHAS